MGVVWITEPFDASTANTQDTDELVTPPASELVTLYEAAQIGDIAGVEAKATRLRQLAPQYVAFANQLLRLAQEFEEQKF